ncbi:MAG: hypothetical protein E6767_16330 [Dysgonomonas sp.]|nr:hypothetical protein [Dysgonomonas sp.]
MSNLSYEKWAVRYQCAKCGNYFGMNRIDLHNQLNFNLIDSILPHSALPKIGNDLVTEKQRKLLVFALLGLRQVRTTTTYQAKYQRVHPFSHLITFL